MNLKLRIKINEMVKKIKYLSPPHSLPYKIDEEWERPEEDVRHLPEEEESNVSVK